MSISKELLELQLISGDKVCAVFDELFTDILTIEYNSACEFMDEFWKRYDPYSKKNGKSNNSLNGGVFEGLLATIFYRSEISPLYIQANVSFVPNIDFDFIGYSKEFGPISLSAKTSLRERYKQADLEGMMLRQVHRRAKSYLITLDKVTAVNTNKKIESGQVLGLEEVVIATHEPFTNLINKLKKLHFYQPEKVEVIKGKRIIS